MARGKGVLPDFILKELADAGFVTGVSPELINPASVDLTITEEGYRVQGIFQPRPGECIRKMLPLVDARTHPPGAVLEVGVTYIFCMGQSVKKFPEDVYAYCNPKSTTGRNNLHVRVLTDGMPSFDAIAPGVDHRELWVAVEPKSFPVIVPPGTAVAQMRLFNADTRFSSLDLEIEMERSPLLFSARKSPFRHKDLVMDERDGTLIMGVSIQKGLVGFRAACAGDVLDFGSGKGAVDPRVFFEPVRSRNGMLTLRKGEFYILATTERLHVPVHLSCEMIPMDARMGEFRTHFAGYIDAGWGPNKGAPIVLEVVPFTDVLVRDGQPFARVRFEHMAAPPEVSYERVGTYVDQSGPRLSKHFAQWK